MESSVGNLGKDFNQVGEELNKTVEDVAGTKAADSAPAVEQGGKTAA